MILDGFENPPPPGGHDFFGFASQELIAEVEVVAGTSVEFVLEYAKVGSPLAGMRVGFRTIDTEVLLDRAEATAGTPTSRWFSSVRRTSGRPKGATAPRWRSRAVRTS